MSTWGAGSVPTFKFKHVEQGPVHAFKVLRASLTTKSNPEKQHPKYTSHQTEEIPQKVWYRCATQHPTAKQLHRPCLLFLPFFSRCEFLLKARWKVFLPHDWNMAPAKGGHFTCGCHLFPGWRCRCETRPIVLEAPAGPKPASSCRVMALFTRSFIHLLCNSLGRFVKHQLQGHRLLLVAADDLKEAATCSALLPKAFVILARVAPRRDVCFDTISHDEREGESAPTPLFPRRRACPWRSAS